MTAPSSGSSPFGVYLQWAIESQTSRYGLIGVAFVIVSLLIVRGLLMVLVAVLSVEVAQRSPHPARPAMPGR